MSELSIVKQRLSEQRDWVIKAMRAEAELEQIRKYTESNTCNLNGITVITSGHKDKTAEHTQKIETYEIMVENLYERVESNWESIFPYINKLTSDKQRKVLLYRYYYGLSWIDIHKSMYKNAEEFTKGDKSKLLKLHRRAIVNLEAFWH